MSDLKQEQQIVDVADLNEVPAGEMKHVEVGEKEILLANSGRKCMRFAIDAVTRMLHFRWVL